MTISAGSTTYGATGGALPSIARASTDVSLSHSPTVRSKEQRRNVSNVLPSYTCGISGKTVLQGLVKSCTK